MCSRFSLAEERDFLALRLGVSAMALANYQPRYNIAPRQEHFIVTTKYENQVARAKWGLISRAANDGREKCLINAKAETVESRPRFAQAFTHRRCVIPASGFYEWAGPNYAMQPYLG